MVPTRSGCALLIDQLLMRISLLFPCLGVQTMLLHRQAGKLNSVMHRRTTSSLSWLGACALLLHPLLGLSASISTNAAPVQWLTVCTMQGISQMPLLLSASDETPSPVPGWVCPDCVPTPPAGALLDCGGPQAPAPAAPPIVMSGGAIKPVVISTDPAHPVRAPPRQSGLNT